MRIGVLGRCDQLSAVVVDIDVHHGNGTEQAFWSSPEVMTISLHQDRCYPDDSGFPEDSGAPGAVGANVNIPLLPGSGLGAYLDALERIVHPLVRSHRPDALIVTVGYDAGGMDPLGRMLLSAQGYGDIVARLCEIADEVCEGRVLGVQEGGYSPIHVPFCGLRVLEALSGRQTGVPDPFDWLDLDPGQGLADFQASHLDRVMTGLRAAGVRL